MSPGKRKVLPVEPTARPSLYLPRFGDLRRRFGAVRRAARGTRRRRGRAGRDAVGDRSLVVFDSGDEVVVQRANRACVSCSSRQAVARADRLARAIVMNTQAEIRQALTDLRDGSFIRYRRPISPARRDSGERLFGHLLEREIRFDMGRARSAMASRAVGRASRAHQASASGASPDGTPSRCALRRRLRRARTVSGAAPESETTTIAPSPAPRPRCGRTLPAGRRHGDDAGAMSAAGMSWQWPTRATKPSRPRGGCAVEIARVGSRPARRPPARSARRRAALLQQSRRLDQHPLPFPFVNRAASSTTARAARRSRIA